MRPLADIEAAIRRAGLAPRGVVALAPDEQEQGLECCRSIVLVGFAGAPGWEAFACAPERGDGLAHPLDRWSRRVVGALAAEFGATALFPFDGPPYRPFQRWAQRAEPVYPSPIGLAIHARHGLWHSYRGALAFAGDLAAAAAQDGADRPASPCLSCSQRPCLSACPVGALTEAGYDVAACAAHLVTDAGRPCMAQGCLARRACPVAPAYGSDQAAFHMQAFLAARG